MSVVPWLCTLVVGDGAGWQIYGCFAAALSAVVCCCARGRPTRIVLMLWLPCARKLARDGPTYGVWLDFGPRRADFDEEHQATAQKRALTHFIGARPFSTLSPQSPKIPRSVPKYRKRTSERSFTMRPAAPRSHSECFWRATHDAKAIAVRHARIAPV